jgi:hypothetical protein
LRSAISRTEGRDKKIEKEDRKGVDKWGECWYSKQAVHEGTERKARDEAGCESKDDEKSP